MLRLNHFSSDETSVGVFPVVIKVVVIIYSTMTGWVRGGSMYSGLPRRLGLLVGT
jgi:hypothetical protein